MLKAGDLARWEDRRVKGVKIGKTRRDRGDITCMLEIPDLGSRGIVLPM